MLSSLVSDREVSQLLSKVLLSINSLYYIIIRIYKYQKFTIFQYRSKIRLSLLEILIDYSRNGQRTRDSNKSNNYSYL
jgi:hypothetical protein